MVDTRQLAVVLVPALAAILITAGERLLLQRPSHFAPNAWLRPPPLPKPWVHTNVLSFAERLSWNGTALAPECFAEGANGTLLATVAFGAVLRAPVDPTSPSVPVFFTPAAVDNFRGPLEQHHMYAWCQTQAAAKNTSAEEKCGRPLGIRVKGARLYVADAYFGVFAATLDAATLDGNATSSEWLVRTDSVSPALRFVNDLDVASDGKLFFTDSSFMHSRRDNRLLVFDNPPAARLLVLRPGAAKPEVVLTGGYFLNGVQLLPDESAVVVVELGRLRLLRCRLPLAPGATCEPEVFADNLPGVPDNVRLSRDGKSLLVGCATPAASPFSLLRFLWTHQRAARLLGVLLSLMPRERALAALEARVPVGGLVLRLALDGTPIAALHDPAGRVPLISHAHEAADGSLWLGSASNAFAARVPQPAWPQK